MSIKQLYTLTLGDLSSKNSEYLPVVNRKPAFSELSEVTNHTR